MGHAFLENNPNALPDIFNFDSSFSTLLLGLPSITLGVFKAKAARSRLNTAIEEWNKTVTAKLNGHDIACKWGDLSDVCETIKLRLNALQAIGSDPSFSTASNVALYWGLIVNANKVIFWMLLSVISNPKLLKDIRQEISTFMRVTVDGDSSGLQIDSGHLPEDCPKISILLVDNKEPLRVESFRIIP
jgi:hypothetical protein